MKQTIDNYQFERKLYSEGIEYIAGTDEVGRGPLAGPVVATAVIMPKNYERVDKQNSMCYNLFN